MSEDKKLPKPMDVAPVPGAEDWASMYTDYLRFDTGTSKELTEWESQQFWFRNHLHWPRAIYPLDEFFVGCDTSYISQYNSRILSIPSAMGMPYRVLNGYIYNSSVEITDEETIGKRLKQFETVIKYCLDNWDRLVEEWIVKVKANIAELEAISFPILPEMEDPIAIIEGDSTTTGHKLLKMNRDMWTLGEKAWCLHYELLGISYSKYVELLFFCTDHGFKDAVESIVKGMRPQVLEPEEKLKDLARSARALGVSEIFKAYAGDEVVVELEKSENGRQWLDQFNAVKYPYFLACEAQSLYFDEKAWIDDLNSLFANVKGYIELLEMGDTLVRDVDALIRERDEATAACRAKLTTEADREAFDHLLGEVREVYKFSEDHIFYVEFWSFGLLRQKVMELGAWLVHEGIVEKPSDILYFQRYELEEVLWDVCQGWGVGIPIKSHATWKKKVAERAKMYEALRSRTPPDLLGHFPEKITEPFTVMLWGITEDRLDEWKKTGEGTEAADVIDGIAASPGVGEGPARVIERFSESDQVKHGDILVTFTTGPAWGPVLARAKGVVLDAGGRMCHGAIVAREERVPAVVGTRTALTNIRSGDIIRVDGDKGTVTILQRAE